MPILIVFSPCFHIKERERETETDRQTEIQTKWKRFIVDVTIIASFFRQIGRYLPQMSYMVSFSGNLEDLSKTSY